MIALRSAGRAGFFKSRDFGQVPFLSPLSYANLAAWWRADLGVKGRTAAQFTIANSEWLSIADPTSLSTGDIDFWVAGWFYADSVTAINQWVVNKWVTAGNQKEYGLGLVGNVLSFYVSNDGAATVSIAFGSVITAGAWHFVLAWHDSVNNTINIKVDNGTTATGAHTTGVFDSTARFGLSSDSQQSVSYFGGREQHFAFGKSPGGGVAGVIAAINTALYNGGAGVNFGDISAANWTAWGGISWWPLTEESGTRADVGGASNTLTDNNTVTSNDGKVAYAVTADASVVARWVEQKSGALLPDQATHTKKPLLKVNIVNGQPVLRFDGTDDFLKVATGALANQPFWGWVVLNDNDAGTRYYFDGGAASKVALYHTLTNLNLNAGSDVGDIDTPSAAELLTFVVNGASSSLKVNGAAFASGDAGAQNQSSGIAIASLNDGTSPLQGDIAEIGFVTGTPSVADLANLKSYINARYNLGVV